MNHPHPYPETRETYRILFAAMREQITRPRPVKAKRAKRIKAK